MKVSPGYSAMLDPDLYPGAGELSSLVDSGVRAYDLWNAVLLVALGQPELHGNMEWKDRIAWVQANPGARDRTVARADKQAQVDKITHLILFDALEHLHRDRVQADRLVAGILQLALEMRLSTKNIRCKIFIRPDMFDGALLHFPDASKLTSNAASLQWTTTNLYGLFFHYLGNHESVESASSAPGPAAGPSILDGIYSSTLLGDEQNQASVFSELAGPYMGANYRKGITYTWLPNHLMDGVEQVSPRSFLNALSMAVDETRGKYASHPYAIYHEGIRKGVQSARRLASMRSARTCPGCARSSNRWRASRCRSTKGLC